jgi:hypothetical protein
MSVSSEEVQELILSPEKIKARRGVFRVILNNTRNSVNTYQLKAADPGGLCDYSFDKETVTLEAGSTATFNLTVKLKKIPLTGASKVCDFTITAIKDRGESVTAKGQLECPSRLPVWALAVGGAVVIVIIVVAVVLGNKGGSSTELLTNNPATTIPATPITTTTPPASIALTTTTPGLTPTSPTATPTATNTIPTTTTATQTTTATATTSPTPTATTQTVPNIAGQWQWDVTVTVAGGVCAGEEGASPTRTVTLTQQGKDVTISGFPNPEKILTGDITFDNTIGKWIVKLHGSYPEDQGITTGDYTLVLNDTFDEMTGEENWNWVGGGGSCPGSKSTVTARKTA